MVKDHDDEAAARQEYEELKYRHQLKRADPEKALAPYDEDIRRDPADSHAYFGRHQVWEQLGRYDRAMDDLNTSMALQPDSVTFKARGNLYRKLADYRSAIADFDRAKALDPEHFADSWGPLFRAECPARLGNEAAALADCARLREDHWTPGLLGAPPATRTKRSPRFGGSPPRRGNPDAPSASEGLRENRPRSGAMT
jgi:tetratricopeptide (TPR) repeat protein